MGKCKICGRGLNPYDLVYRFDDTGDVVCYLDDCFKSYVRGRLPYLVGYACIFNKGEGEGESGAE